MSAATEQSNDPNDTGQNTSANTNPGAAGAVGRRNRDRPLNPSLRPQRLFHKVGIAMKAVDKKLFDKKVTGLSDWLADDEMDDFRRTIRCIIRTKYDATFDSWPKRVMHNYVPDAREAIEQAINERWELFDAAKVTNEEHDDFVPNELLYPRFYPE